MTRRTYAEQQVLDLCRWFEEFDQHLYRNNFQACEGLLEEIRTPLYSLSTQEWAYVDSREGVLWLRRGIEHHKRGNFEETQTCYQRSLEIQRRVRCRDGQADTELFQSFLVADRAAGEPNPNLQNFAEELHVLGGSESLLSDRLAKVAPEERLPIIVAAVNARLTKPLIQAASSEDLQMRMLGMVSLGRFKEINEVQLLLNGLRDPNWFVRWRAAEALRQQQAVEESVTEVVCEVLEQETDPEVRRELAILLGKGDNRVIPTLVAALSDPDPDVRIAVVEALAQVGDSRCLLNLQTIATGKDFLGRSVKQVAQRAMEAIAARSLRLGVPSGLTLIVSQEKEGQYSTIRAAIKEAVPGTRILVHPGRYDEGLVVDKPLEIVGDGPMEEIIIESTASSCIFMETNYAIVRGLTLCGRASLNNKKCFTVEISQGQLVLEDCDITSDSLSCVGILASANPIIRRCQIHDSQQDGVFVYENGQGTLEDCDIFGNRLSGIEIKQGGNPAIRRCQIHDGHQNGIYIWEDGQGTVEDCDIFGNAYAGIEIKQEGDPVIRRCQVHDNQQNGIYVRENGRGTVEDCDIYGNTLSGVEIKQEGNPVICRCQIHDGQQDGVFVYERGQGTLEDCDIFGNALSGVEIRQGGNPLLRRCKIHDGKQDGIYVWESGQGAVKDCDIFGNALAGVSIKQGGNPVIRRCQIHDGKQNGIYVREDGRGTVEDCSIFGNVLSGVEIKQGGNPTIRRCQIYRSNQDGVFVYENGQGTVEDCNIFCNALSGIEITQGGNPTIRRCQIHHGEQDGVFVHGYGQGTVEDCKIFGNALAGVSIKQGGNPVIRRCDIHDGK